MIHQPLSYYISEQDEALKFHILNVWQWSLMLFILPNNQVIVFDCYITQDTEEDIVKYLTKHIPKRLNDQSQEAQRIDVFINSHRDLDHLQGIKLLNDNFPISEIRDSGQYGATGNDNYNNYMELKRNVTSQEISQWQFWSLWEDFKITCLNPKEWIDINADDTTDKAQHIKCIVLKIEYASKSILLTWDTWYDVWRDYIIPTYWENVKSNILVASHHWSRSFFTDSALNDSIDPEGNPDTTYMEHINLINPDTVLISCGECKEPHNLPNKEAVAIYKEKSSNSQTYQTYFVGHIQWFIKKDGHWSIIPARFSNTRKQSTPSHFDFDIICKSKEWIDYPSNSNIGIWENLIFSLQTKWWLWDVQNLKAYWEVSNWWFQDHDDHDEIYYKSNKEQVKRSIFERKVSYRWKHLVRCRVSWSSSDITKIFVVNWV